MTRHGPTVLVSDEFGPLISIGGVMSPLDDLWTLLWEDLRHNATGRPSGAAIIARHRPAIEAELRRSLAEQVDQFCRDSSDHGISASEFRALIEGSDPASPEPRVGRVIPDTSGDTPFVGEHPGCAYDAPHRHAATPVAGSTTTQPDPTIRERLRELAAKATPGGWDAPIQVEHGDYGSVLSRWIEAVEAADGRPVCMFHDDYGHDSWADATYIAAANPETIRALLDELDTLERRVRAAEERLSEITDAAREAVGLGGPERLSVDDVDAHNRLRSLISGTKEPTDG